MTRSPPTFPRESQGRVASALVPGALMTNCLFPFGKDCAGNHSNNNSFSKGKLSLLSPRAAQLLSVTSRQKADSLESIKGSPRQRRAAVCSPAEGEPGALAQRRGVGGLWVSWPRAGQLESSASEAFKNGSVTCPCPSHSTCQAVQLPFPGPCAPAAASLSHCHRPKPCALGVE